MSTLGTLGGKRVALVPLTKVMKQETDGGRQ